jgi:hypothetical protein
MEVLHQVKVGNLGKVPYFPVWVMHYQSHYSVVFQKEDTRVVRSFPDHVDAATLPLPANAIGARAEVFYWDQLGGQDGEIHLTVTLEASPVPPPGPNVIVPYLNQVLRLIPGWQTARISWNGQEPLL